MHTEWGMGLPNGPFVSDDWPRLQSLGVRHYVDLADFASRWASIHQQQPDARIHARIDLRGDFNHLLTLDCKDMKTLIDAYGPQVRTWRIRNEPNIESPGTTPDEWYRYLVALGTFLRNSYTLQHKSVDVYTPAVSPGTPGWQAWLLATARGAKDGYFSGMDCHAYGNPDEAMRIVQAYRWVWNGPLLVSEYNFGAGRSYDLGQYAKDIPQFVRRCDPYNVQAVCPFIWYWDNPDMSLPTTVDIKNTPAEKAIRIAIQGEQVMSDYAPAEWIGSPNFGYPRGTPGRSGHQPVAIVDHIAQGTRQGAIDWFNNPASQDSSTYFVCLDGTVLQFVKEADAAWANGIDFTLGYSRYKSDLSVPWIADLWNKPPEVGVANSVVISIEHEGMSGDPMPEAQYQATLALHKDIFQRYAWPFESSRVCGHYQIDSVERAFCPGLGFPMARLRSDLSLAMHPPVDVNKADVGVYSAWAQLRLAWGSGRTDDTEVRGGVGRAAFIAFLEGTGRDAGSLQRWGWPCDA